MASSYDFFITGEHEAGKALVGSILGAQGFTLAPTPAGGFVAKRGSRAATIWLGGLAGKNFQLTFIVEFFVDAQGQLVARLNRNMAAGALKGGAIGAAKTDNAFVATADALGTGLSGSGMLTNSIAN